MHQFGVLYCFKRHQLSRRCFDSLFVLHHYQLPRLETTCRTSSTGTSLVTGKIWLGHQHCVSFVPRTCLVLCLLATCHTGHSRDDELVFYYVRRDYHFCACLLRSIRETPVCGACTTGKERRVTCWKQMSKYFVVGPKIGNISSCTYYEVEYLISKKPIS